MKYIVITGGVISGLGKGITASSIGLLLKNKGYSVTSIKIDPYYIPAYLGLGIAYGNLGRNKDAVDVFKEGIKLDNIHAFVAQMQMGIATIAYDKMNNDEMSIKYVKKALQAYTDQGNYAGVAQAGQKLKQNSPKS